MKPIMERVDNVGALTMGAVKGDEDGLTEGEAGACFQMVGVVGIGLGGKGNSSSNPFLVVWICCDVASPEEDLIVV